MAACSAQTLRRMRRSLLHREFRWEIADASRWFQRCRYKPARTASKLDATGVKPQQGDEIQALCKEGLLNKAVDVLFRMDEHGFVPPVHVYKCILKACSTRKALVQAKRVHRQLAKHGFQSSVSLGEYLVVVFVKCGGLEDALQVFKALPHRTVLSWTAVILGHTVSGKDRESLRMYQWMQEDGVKPDTYTFVSLLKACGNLANLEEGKRIHAEAVKYNCEADMFVRTCLVDMYRKCGSIINAQNAFDGLSQPDVVSWTVMLAAYVEQGQAEKALELYERMREEGVSPNARTSMTALQACGMIADMEAHIAVNGRSIKVKSFTKGKAMHSYAQVKGYGSDMFVCTTLVSMYGKCGSVQDARYVFDALCQQEVASWNVMLSLYVQQGEAEKACQLYKEMQEEGMSPDGRTFMGVLQACTLLAQEEDAVIVNGHSIKVTGLARGKSVHADTRMKGYDSDIFVVNTLLSMYGKSGDVVDAQNLFDKMPRQDVVSWTSMLVAYVAQGQAEKALLLYEQLRKEFVSPDVLTFVTAVQVCAMLAEKEDDATLEGTFLKVKCLEMGKAMHADAHRMEYDTDAFFGSTIINMYSKCGSIVDAQNVFDTLPQRDVVAWTAIVSAYVEQGQAATALNLCQQMQEEGITPNDRTCVIMLQACGILAEKEDVLDHGFNKVRALEKGKAIHEYAKRKGYESDAFVGITLLSMYGKCGSILDARSVFEALSKRSVVAWNAMLAAYVGQGQGEEALQLYERMQQDSATPNDITFICLLQACSNTGRLETLREIHRTLITTKYDDLSSFLVSTLINAYGRCASMVDARAVFDALPHAELVSWNALICGYVREGNFRSSLQCYSEMLLAGIKPDGVTYLSLLCACSHAGLVEQGLEYFESMNRDHGIIPQIAHYASVVDLLGRAGCSSEVEDMISTMPMQPDLAMLLCLLGACRMHSKVVLGEQIFQYAVRLQPTHAAAYVIMSNIYADAGLLEHAENLKLSSYQAGAWAKPGHSWIEHGKEIDTFIVGGSKQPQQEQLYRLLRQLRPHSTREV